MLVAMRRFRWSLVLFLPVFLAACQTSGEIDNPAQRRATWFSFLSGEDIAAECIASGREQLRLIYYADRDIQVRIYDIDLGLRPEPQLRSRVLTFVANDWFPLPILTDPTRPFRPFESIANLSIESAEAIVTELRDAGWATQPPPIGRRIASHSYAWLIAGCIDGQFHYQVFEYPDEEFLNFRFPAVLFDLDTTEIDVAQHPNDGIRRRYSQGFGSTPDEPNDEMLRGRRHNLVVNARGVEFSY